MSRLRLHPENHLVGRIGWLRAAVLGANDGIISTASLIVGVAAASESACAAADGEGCLGGASSRRARNIGIHSCPTGAGCADIGADVFHWCGHAITYGRSFACECAGSGRVGGASLVFLALLGAIGARAGGANVLRATVRVTFWGALALGITAGIGKLFGTVV